ncbi:Rrf2 family transcriptional regulator [Seonamhaeicola sediminis]|uniref:Rrf2 family transcriptional regulator n=1 Tax=Seonamhaeicola sediminis TaxID=2528206 RepID=A0A562YFP0_9FLAO|nr:Rrf2 family transcriptional regulator [Seonamhaeicola sediminis]TWO33408.1 Rrf2 family transcriptional regulator [Seonamhaeicola sediminis]
MLSKKTKYGLKALTFIARSESGMPVRVGEIAGSESIPQKFLETILLTLRKAGILGSKKGKHGGYYLRSHPSAVKMTDVMRVLEGPIAMVPCVSLNYYEKCDDCPDEHQCSVHRLMIEVRDSTLKVLRNTTLEDLALKDS